MNWDNFFIAQAGAAAALTGLIFVAVSINLASILKGTFLPNRALQSIILLMNILLISSAMLIPGQALPFIGSEILILGLTLWAVLLKLNLSIICTNPPEFKRQSRINFWMVQIAIVPFVISGICILLAGEKGIYVLVPGVLFSFSKAVVDSWVLLIEINR